MQGRNIGGGYGRGGRGSGKGMILNHCNFCRFFLSHSQESFSEVNETD